jgi:hypothetical protein
MSRIISLICGTTFMIHFQISKEQHQCLLGLTKYQPPSAVEEKLDQMWMISLGLAVARRGWLEAKDVLNTLPLKEILKWCHSRS